MVSVARPMVKSFTSASVTTTRGTIGERGNDEHDGSARQRRGTAGTGEQAKINAPLAAHADWQPAAARRDPVELLIEQNATREADLVPVRHGRMLVSPFTFYRGAAKLMAADLAGSPTCGLDVQLCGDAHLSNFGGFASPERELLVRAQRFRRDAAGAVRI